MNKITYAIILLVMLALPNVASAQRTNTSETNPTPTTEVTRSPRSSTSTLRGEDEWQWESSREFLAATRLDLDGADADLMAYLMTDPDVLEDTVDMDYEAEIELPRTIRECYGAEMSDRYMTIYFIACPDGDYLNMIIGTDLDDAIDIAEQMQDGDVPIAPRGYKVTS